MLGNFQNSTATNSGFSGPKVNEKLHDDNFKTKSDFGGDQKNIRNSVHKDLQQSQQQNGGGGSVDMIGDRRNKY